MTNIKEAVEKFIIRACEENARPEEVQALPAVIRAYCEMEYCRSRITHRTSNDREVEIREDEALKGNQQLNIYEAVKQALAIDGFIANPSWPHLAIKPTNTTRNCEVHGMESPPHRGWQPKAEDFTREDWTVLTTIDELPLKKHSPS